MMVRRTVAAVLLTAGLTFAGANPATAKPISKQNCHQLAKTLRRIMRDLAPDKPFKVQSKATKDASTLNRRVDALGGCPDEASLQ